PGAEDVEVATHCIVVAVAIGMREENKHRLELLVKEGANTIVIDPVLSPNFKSTHS
ncbi:unnamed protein product, partial [Urochloa humidicola]